MSAITVIKTAAKGAYGASKFFLTKNGPSIATATGVGCMLGSTVLAAKETREGFDDIMKDHRYRFGKQEMVETTHADEEGKKLLDSFEHKLTKGQIVRERIMNYIRTGAQFVRLYAPAISLAVAGAGLIFGAHNVMLRRNSALSLAYAGLDSAYQAYRKRVANKLGDEEESRLYENVPELLNDNDDVDENTIENDRVIMEESGWDTHLYRRVFDQRNPNFSSSFRANMIFLTCCEQALNAKLKYQGFLTLNDSLKQVDMKQTNIGQITGWALDGLETKTEGDGYIQIIPASIRKIYNEGGKHSPIIPLEFNVDGPIYNKIDDVARGGSDAEVVDELVEALV